MKLSFSLPSKSQSNRSKKASQSFSATDAGPTTADSSAKNYVTEFNSAEAQVDPQSKPKFIPPVPNQWRPNKKLKNLPNLPSLKSEGENTLQFEVVPDGNPDSSDNSMAYGLNLRNKQSGVNDGSANDGSEESNLPISDLELRKLREDLEKLPEDTGIDEYTDMPVEGFGAAVLSGYGWNKGRGIGRNAKEDTKILEVKKRAGRGGLGYEGELPDNQNGNNSNDGETFESRSVRPNKREDWNKSEDTSF